LVLSLNDSKLKTMSKKHINSLNDFSLNLLLDYVFLKALIFYVGMEEFKKDFPTELLL
jgi:hypothetical protein